MNLDYLSVCSGIEAVSVAWDEFARPVAFAEIDPFASAVLSYRFPSVPNLGDLTTIAPRIASGELVAPSVLIGGTPCQAFSTAGLRGSMTDARGQLSLSFVEVANAIDAARFVRRQRACGVVWENVPGCLSTDDNAFGCLLAALAGEDMPLVPAGGRWSHAGYVFGPQRAIAWRVLDAQYFGVPQRRPRVFVVASAASGVDPIKILFERDGVRRDIAPGIQAGRGASTGLAGGARKRGQWDVDETGLQRTVGTLCADTHPGAYSGQDAYTGRLVPVFGPDGSAIAVRRLLPIEVERLQGFPDDWTNIPWRGKPEAPDSLRYAAVGNSMAVPVMRWIGKRLLRAIKSPPYRLPKVE